ncbi:MAG: HAD family hydrolase [Verrucomicrobia bacterium]|nr:MAG: HAD family hydrolase [Verrucomicrobiota bacterium]
MHMRGMIFDLDGTLVDSLAGIAAATNHALNEMNYPQHPLSAIRQFVGNGARTLLRRAAPSSAEENDLMALEQFFKAAYACSWQDGTQVYPGIYEIIDACRARKLSLAVLSNKPDIFTQEMVEYFFPHAAFDSVMGHRVSFPHKPDPASALETARRMKCAPSDCVIIGDSTMDVETAQNAGMGAIAVTWGFHDREKLSASGAKLIFDAPHQLQQWIKDSASLNLLAN